MFPKLVNMDMSLQAPESSRIFDHYADDNELWFDFVADVGDGFHSSYEVARVMAQPTLKLQYVLGAACSRELKQVKKPALPAAGSSTSNLSRSSVLTRAPAHFPCFPEKSARCCRNHFHSAFSLGLFLQ